MNTELSENDLLRLSLISDDKTLEMIGYMLYEKAQKDKIAQNKTIEINEEKERELQIDQEKEKLYNRIENEQKKIDSIIIPDAEITNIRSKHK